MNEMLDASAALQKAYYELLNGNIIVDGEVIPVFDRVPDGQKGSYITIGDDTVVTRGGKTFHGQEVTFTVQVWTTFPADSGGKRKAKQIAAEVIKKVVTFPVSLNLQDHEVLTATLDYEDGLESLEEAEFTYRRLLRFRHIIIQKEV
jgi:hypothetical protein